MAPAPGSDGGPPEQDASPERLPVPTLTELHNEILLPSCVLGRCHITQAPAAGLSLTGRRVSPYRALVNVPSMFVPGRMLVVPFDVEASYVIEKLTAERPAVGGPMPPFGPLAPGDIDRISAWIEAGAPDN